jgi:hypothetical protein
MRSSLIDGGQSDLLFDQFRDFVNKYFDTNEDFKKRLFEAFDFGKSGCVATQTTSSPPRRSGGSSTPQRSTTQE